MKEEHKIQVFLVIATVIMSVAPIIYAELKAHGFNRGMLPK